MLYGKIVYGDKPIDIVKKVFHYIVFLFQVEFECLPRYIW